MSEVATNDVELSEANVAGDASKADALSQDATTLGIFAEDSKYSTLTEVMKIDCAYACWKAYICCKANGPDIAKQVPMVNQGMSYAEQANAASGGLFYEYAEAVGDLCCQLMIWQEAKPGVSFLLENFKDADEKEERIGDAFIVTDGRTSENRLMGCDKGHWAVKTSDQNATTMYDIQYYRDACGCMKTHYVFTYPPKEGDKPVIVASKMMRPPSQGCINFAECFSCSPYTIDNKIQTPTQQFTVPEDYNQNSPHSAESMGGKETSEVSIVTKSACFICCGGKRHASVDIPTWYALGALEEKEGSSVEKLKDQFKDSRMMFQDMSPCAKISANCSLSGSDVLGMAGLDSVAGLADIAEVAGDAADAKAAKDSSTVKWSKADHTATGFEFPSYFSDAQKAGLILMTMEFNIANQ
jgi:hypothetical protein